MSFLFKMLFKLKSHSFYGKMIEDLEIHKGTKSTLTDTIDRSYSLFFMMVDACNVKSSKRKVEIQLHFQRGDSLSA